MPTDVRPANLPNLNLAHFDEDSDVVAQAELLYEQNPSVVYLQCDAMYMERMRRLLPALRAADVPVMLLLKCTSVLPVDRVLPQLAFLREWDQCSLINLLQLGQPWIPTASAAELNTEAKIELKWFQEWWSASQGPRMARYPGLPWRSFIRKINGENYQFAKDLLAQSDAAALTNLVQNFLSNKKKVVCVFPKRWGKDS